MSRSVAMVVAGRYRVLPGTVVTEQNVALLWFDKPGQEKE
jgi:hypothetical protein